MADPDSAGTGSGETGGHRGVHRSAPRPRPRLRLRMYLLVVALVLGVSGGALLWAGLTQSSGQQPVAAAGTIPLPAAVTVPPVSTPTAPPSPGPTVPLSRSVPVSIQVPSIGVNSTLLSLGLSPDQTVQTPKDFSKAGWYDLGPTPGQAGAAVILGHIDSYRGPAVFYRLHTLNPGDQIQVTRSDGTTATFTVDARRQYPKTQFPAQDVYGAVDYAGLRLVTCGGQFDNTAKSYLDNIVIYAHHTATT